MATVTVRGLDDEVRDRLRVRAARNGRSMEAEAREILRAAVTDDGAQDGLFEALRNRFSALGGVDLELPSREDLARAAEFDQ